MEHACCKCDFIAINNTPSQPDTCPKCGACLHHACDEHFDDFRDERDEEPVGDEDYHG
jgi:hypothetical protein